MLPHVLYGCENWAFIVWKEYELTLFHNRAIKRTFGPSRGTDMRMQKTAE